MAVLASLLPNPVRLNRLRAAARGRHTLVACDDWYALTRACESEPVQLVVLDLFAEERVSFDRLRVLRQRFPRIAFVAYVEARPERARDLFDAGRFGIDALVLADEDDAAPSLNALLEQAESRSVAGLLRRELIDLEPTARDALLLAVTRASERLSALALARVMGISRRTLALRLAEAGFPPPQRLLTWGRLLVAAHMLEERQRSADGIALTLQFPSGSAFRNTCQRYLHATPGEIRSRGGVRYALRVLLRQRRPRRDGGAARPAPLRSPARAPQLAV